MTVSLSLENAALNVIGIIEITGAGLLVGFVFGDVGGVCTGVTSDSVFVIDCMIVVLAEGCSVVVIVRSADGEVAAGGAGGESDGDGAGVESNVRVPILMEVSETVAMGLATDVDTTTGEVLVCPLSPPLPARMLVAAAELVHPTYTPMVSFMGNAKHSSPLEHREMTKFPA